jgi:hypothetical protein
VELAVRILCVNSEVAFGRFVISLNALRPHRDCSQRNPIGLEDFATAQQRQAASRFQDDNLIGLNWGSSRRAVQPQHEDSRELSAAITHTLVFYAEAAL